MNHTLKAVTKGEHRINQASSHLIGNLKDIVANKKTIYTQLKEKTEVMKDKIGLLDDLNKKIEGVYEKINKRQELFEGGNSREITLRDAIHKLKVCNIPHS